MRYLKILCIIGSLFFYGCSGQSNDPVGKLVEISGTVEIRKASEEEFKEANIGLNLYHEMAVRTGMKSKAEISFARGGSLILSSNAFFQVKSGQVLGKQTKGFGKYEIDKQPNPVSVTTPIGVTTILGTKFRQVVDESSVEIFLEEGSLEFTDNEGNKTSIKEGQKLLVEKGKALSEAVPFDQFDIKKLFNEEKSLKNF